MFTRVVKTYGETYNIEVTADDEDGDAVEITGAMRVVEGAIDGPELVPEFAMTQASAIKVTASLDTGDAPWKVGSFFYDVRITDGSGNDYWTEPINLILEARATPSS